VRRVLLVKSSKRLPFSFVLKDVVVNQHLRLHQRKQKMKSLLTVVSLPRIFWIALLSSICLLLPARADGVSLDPTFGSGGVVTTHVLNNDFGSEVLIQPDGKLIVAGTTSYDNPGTRLYDVAVARYQLNTSVPRAALFDFDGDGKSDVSIYRADTENASSLSYWHLIRSSDNQLLVPQFGNG
jgi:hypothetical protein